MYDIGRGRGREDGKWRRRSVSWPRFDGLGSWGDDKKYLKSCRGHLQSAGEFFGFLDFLRGGICMLYV
jgi:hypothetical protein